MVPVPNFREMPRWPLYGTVEPDSKWLTTITHPWRKLALWNKIGRGGGVAPGLPLLKLGKKQIHLSAPPPISRL